MGIGCTLTGTRLPNQNAGHASGAMDGVLDDVGTESFYQGPEGAEQLFRIKFKSGEEQFYQGERGAERLVRIKYTSGEERLYEGARGDEVCVYATWPDGTHWCPSNAFDSIRPVKSTWMRRVFRYFFSGTLVAR